MPRRKSQPTLDFIKEVVDRIKAGAEPEVCAESLGVHAHVFQDWLDRGEHQKKDTPCRRLYLQVRAAAAAAQVSLVVDVRVAAKKSGKVALELLEKLAETPDVSRGMKHMMRNLKRLRSDSRGVALDENDGDLQIPECLARGSKVVRHPVPREDQPVSVDNSEIA